MEALYWPNLDLEIRVSIEDIEALQLKTKVTKKEEGCRVDYNYPVIEAELKDESGRKIGTVKLQNCVADKLMQEIGKREMCEAEKRGVYFLKTGPEEWDIKLSHRSNQELKRDGSLTRRIPLHNSQLLIYIPEV